MANLLKQCEEDIKRKLEKLKELQATLENALQAIEKVHELEGDNLQGSPDDILKKILEQSIKKSKEMGKSPGIVNGDAEKKTSVTPAAQLEKQKPDGVKHSPTQPTIAKTENTPKQTAFEQDDTDQFITHLLCTSGAKVGVKYKVEVTSPLAVNGTFWACNVETGFVEDKLEPLSDKLRAATQQDRSLWVVDNLTKMVCVKSGDNGLWMRAKVVKQNTTNSVRVQFVDIGRTEDCAKSRLCKLPSEYESIPFMAFHCLLSEEKIKVQYENKWKFSDLVKKKVLNFTVQKLIPDNDEKLVFGKLETILDSPPILVNEQIIPGCLRMQAEKESNYDTKSITSRDIRVQNSNGGKEITSVSQIIRNNSIGDEGSIHSKAAVTSKPLPPSTMQSEKENIPPPTAQVKSPKIPTLPPIKIPERNSPDESSWGESRTPGADEHAQLSPLDEHIFDSPTNSMEEAQLKQVLGRKPSSSDNGGPKHDDLELQSNLLTLMEKKNLLLQSPPSPERDQMLQAIHHFIMNQQNRIKQFENSDIPLPPNMFFNQPIPNMTPMNVPYQQQPNYPLASIGTRAPSNQPIPPLHQFSTSLQSGNDFSVKIQQLDAITRCLQMPSGVLDHQQIQQLQNAQESLLRQLEEFKKNQMEILLQNQQHQQQQQQQQQQMQTQQRKEQENSLAMNEQLQHLIRKRDEMLMQSNESLGNSIHSTGSTDLLDEINKKTEEFRQQTISPLVKSEADLTEQRASPAVKVFNEGVVEVTHTSKFDSTPKVKNFITPSYEKICTESKEDWIARELLNLEHGYLTQQKTRFFSVLIHEIRDRFLPNLAMTVKTGYLLLSGLDAKIFNKEWERVDGPVFLINRFKLYDGTWMSGGILQVVSKVEKDPRGSNTNLSHRCKANIISSAIVNDLPWFRSDKNTREIPMDVAFRYIQLIVSRLQEGKCTSLFKYQEQRIRQQQQVNCMPSTRNNPEAANNSYEGMNSSSYFSEPNPTSIQSNSFTTSPPNTFVPDCEEDWELELKSPKHVPPQTKSSAEDLGSGDEGERDLNAEIEAFGLSKDDFN